MALFGRESLAGKARADRFHQWAQQRSGYALFSCLVGVVAVLDFFTVVIGFGLGIVAVVLGVMGLKDISVRQGIVGRDFCKAGIVLGSLAILLSCAIGCWYYF